MTSASDRAVKRISVAATIGLVLMVVATAAYIGWPRVAGAIGVKPSVPPPAYAAGQHIDAPAEWYNSAPRTLVIFARASCAACEKAQPFLKELVGRMNGVGAAVMAHPPGAPEEDAQFARSLGVTDNHIVIVDRRLRVKSTPTLVLVNQQGMIIEAWEGVGPPEHQATIAKALDAALR